MFRGYRNKYKNLSKTDSNLNRHLEQSGFPHFHPSSSQPHQSSWSPPAPPGHTCDCTAVQAWLQPLYSHPQWLKAADHPRINYSVELVHICHSYRNNHLYSGKYSISRNKPCSSKLLRDWSFEFIMKCLSKDSRAPLAFSLYLEATRTNKDPPLPLLTPIHHHSGPREQGSWTNYWTSCWPLN